MFDESVLLLCAASSSALLFTLLAVVRVCFQFGHNGIPTIRTAARVSEQHRCGTAKSRPASPLNAPAKHIQSRNLPPVERLDAIESCPVHHDGERIPQRILLFPALQHPRQRTFEHLLHTSPSAGTSSPPPPHVADKPVSQPSATAHAIESMTAPVVLKEWLECQMLAVAIKEAHGTQK